MVGAAETIEAAPATTPTPSSAATTHTNTNTFESGAASSIAASPELAPPSPTSPASPVPPALEETPISKKPAAVPSGPSSTTDPTTTTSSRTAEYYDVNADVEAARQCPPFVQQPPPDTPSKEHFRDISLGPFTLHRLFLLAFVAGCSAGVYYLQRVIWPESDSATDDVAWMWLGIVWLIPLPSMLAWIVGAVWFHYNTKLDRVAAIHHKVVLRIVSRGTNSACLLSTIRRCQMEMQKTPLFPYLVEVVTDGDVFKAPDEADVLHTRVPESYNSPNSSRFKARALHYACLYSPVPADAWIVHLDEESQPTSSAIKGIADMVGRCETSGDVRRIGQGMILYHRGWKTHPLLTLADMRRTGDDVGHFYLQHRLGFTIFGLHGSYVVARADVERELGFDVGPHGSITEDAWWILLAMRRGIRTAWVDGCLEEQSTQSMPDFLKQRRRWYVGLWKVGLHCPVPLRFRLLLLYNTLSWVIVPLVLPLQLVYLTLSIVLDKRIVVGIRILTTVILVATASVYVTGLVPNMREHGTPWYRGIFWLFLQLVLLPAFVLLEACGVVLAFFSPLSQNAKGFHVVRKSGYVPSSGSSTDGLTSGTSAE